VYKTLKLEMNINNLRKATSYKFRGSSIYVLECDHWSMEEV